MTKPHFLITNKMLNLMVDITERITRLELEKDRNLHLRKVNRIRSIHSSLAVENNSLSLDQMSDIINGKRVLGAPKEIREVQNAYEAYELAFKLNPYSVEDFLKAHRLMTGGLIRESGMFRLGDVGVFDSLGNVIHIGARPQFVSNLVSELFSWAQHDDTPDLIKSCVVHFEIEIIHPFADGNGRMGRLWQNLILSKWQKIFEWIPIETIIYENQQNYYDMLTQGGKQNDSTQFIEFMLKVILETITSFNKHKVSNKLSVILSDKVLDGLNNHEKEFFSIIYSYIKQNKEINTAKAIELTNKPSSTIRRYFSKFVNLGILVPVGTNKNRKYHLK